METRTVDVDGPLHLADFGGDGPPIILVHGLGGSHLNWMLVGDGLAEHGRVVAIDLPGFGRSPKGGRSTAVIPLRNLLARFVKHELGEPAVLVGNSMGGLICLLLAARFPELTRGYVGVASAAPRRLVPAVDPRVAALFAAYMIPGLAQRVMRWRYDRLGPERIYEEVADFCVVDRSRIPDDAMAAHLDLARERYESMPWAYDASAEATRSLIPFLFKEKTMGEILQRVEAPGLLVQGEGDKLVPFRLARRVAELRADWDFEVFEGCGHVPQLEMPDRFVDVVGSWIAQLASNGGPR
jgi:pimeloyl-ACP methyl ester carboxylesterase